MIRISLIGPWVPLLSHRWILLECIGDAGLPDTFIGLMDKFRRGSFQSGTCCNAGSFAGHPSSMAWKFGKLLWNLY